MKSQVTNTKREVPTGYIAFVIYFQEHYKLTIWGGNSRLLSSISCYPSKPFRQRSALAVGILIFLEKCACSLFQIQEHFLVIMQQKTRFSTTPFLDADTLQVIQSTLSKTDTFGTSSKCSSQRGVRLIESQIKGVEKGRDQL